MMLNDSGQEEVVVASGVIAPVVEEVEMLEKGLLILLDR